MDDSCAVCADNLEWVAYGACGHRKACATCVVRLRFICNDRRCCICKTESNVIFVTKFQALGDYRRIISDFSVLPSEVREGRVGTYWYHEDTQAFFDDVDHYRIIKAMCRLSCSVCDKMEAQGAKRQGKFRNIEQLKGHLFHRHRLVMCGLCLEGRKVFICEQKLYTRAQLNQHINTGDSEVDGTESERGGFMGHPMCESCKTPFYGDNELYSHMSTEHYTCHICQRFIFAEIITYGHNTMEHRGRMSRASIPTNFQYRQSNEDNRRGRGRTFRRELSDNDHQLSMAIESSLDTASDPPASPTAQVVSDPLVQPCKLLSSTDSNSAAGYLKALGGGSRGVPWQESSFPPLPNGPSLSQQKLKHSSEGLANNTMAAHLRRQKNGNTNVFNSAQAWPVTSRRPVQASNIPLQDSSFPPLPIGPSIRQQKLKHSSEGLANNTMAAHLRRQKNGNTNVFNSAQAWPVTSRRPVQASNIPLQDSSFPPLPIGPSTSQQKPKHSSEGLANNTMAAHLRRQKNGKTTVFNSGQAWPVTGRRPTSRCL
ncbi:hypothetical protein QUC31_005014 [Theobroma cacao]